MRFWNIVNDSYRINALLYINQNDVLNKVKFEKVHSFLRIWYKLVLHFTGKLCCKIVIQLLACTVYVSTVRRLKFTQIICWCKPLFKQVCLPSLFCQTGIDSPKRKFSYRKLGPDVMKTLRGPVVELFCPYLDYV